MNYNIKESSKNSLKINLRYVYLLALGALYILSSTSWRLPIVEINYSILFYAFILIVPFLIINSYSISKKFVIFYILFILFLLIHILIPLVKLNFIPSVNPKDMPYVMEYLIKLLLGPIVIYLFSKIIKNKEDLIYFIFTSAATLVVIYVYLHYLYIFVYGEPYVGVVIDGLGMKAYKNTFALSLVLLFPYFFYYLIQKKYSYIVRLVSLIAIITIFVAMVFINSRSMVIIGIIEILIFFYFSSSRKFKFYVIIAAICASPLLTNISSDIFYSKIYKKSFNPDVELQEIISSYENYYILKSHRGWLLHEAVNGSMKNLFIGHGMGEFRIRDTNRGSKTDTHNDFTLILYEYGLIGFLLFLYFIYYLIKKFYNYKKLFKTHEDKDNYDLVVASFASIIGIIISMLFTNILHSLILFWIHIAIYMSIVDKIIINNKKDFN